MCQIVITHSANECHPAPGFEAAAPGFSLFIFFFRRGSFYVSQAGLELMILLPQSPSARITGMCHHSQLCTWFLSYLVLVKSVEYDCFYFILYYIIAVLGTILVHLQKCLQYILVRFMPSIILLYSPNAVLRIVSAGLIFPFFNCFNEKLRLFSDKELEVAFLPNF
jgi:hypothetical protein